MTLAPAETDWRAPTPGTPLESAWRSVCDPGFRPPLIAAERQAAPPPAAKPAAAPKPALAAVAPTAPTLMTAAGPSTAAGPAIQLVSSQREADAWQAVGRLRIKFASLQDLAPAVETAQVRGGTVYRGLLTGLPSHEAARSACDELKRAGQDCLAR